MKLNNTRIVKRLDCIANPQRIASIIIALLSLAISYLQVQHLYKPAACFIVNNNKTIITPDKGKELVINKKVPEILSEISMISYWVFVCISFFDAESNKVYIEDIHHTSKSILSPFSPPPEL